MAGTPYPFLAGLTVAQISEFSLILAALGLSLGHITNATVGLITVGGIITIGASTYLIRYSHTIYERIKHRIAVFERGGQHRVGANARTRVSAVFGSAEDPHFLSPSRCPRSAP